MLCPRLMSGCCANQFSLPSKQPTRQHNVLKYPVPPEFLQRQLQPWTLPALPSIQATGQAFELWRAPCMDRAWPGACISTLTLHLFRCPQSAVPSQTACRCRHLEFRANGDIQTVSFAEKKNSRKKFGIRKTEWKKNRI